MKPTIVDADTGKELWRVAECAEHGGVSPSTWRSYMRPGLSAPAAVAHLDARTPLWDAEQVRAWHAARPGRGARTDLAH